jgi:hypothetical protein
MGHLSWLDMDLCIAELDHYDKACEGVAPLKRCLASAFAKPTARSGSCP